MGRTQRSTRVRAAIVGSLTAVLLSSDAAATASAQTHEEAIQMSWDGRGLAEETRESFLGAPITVPGDRAERTLLVRNDGPSAGVLRAAITEVDLLGSGSAADGRGFYDDLTVHWDAGQGSVSELSMAELHANDTTHIFQTNLEQDATAELTIGYDFPLEATSGNRSEAGPRSGSFEVLLTLGAEAPAGVEHSPPEDRRSERHPAESPFIPGGETMVGEAEENFLTPQRSGPSFLADTGWGTLWLAALGVTAVGLGWWLRRTAAKRELGRRR